MWCLYTKLLWPLIIRLWEPVLSPPEFLSADWVRHRSPDSCFWFCQASATSSTTWRLHQLPRGAWVGRGFHDNTVDSGSPCQWRVLVVVPLHQAIDLPVGRLYAYEQVTWLGRCVLITEPTLRVRCDIPPRWSTKWRYAHQLIQCG